MHGKRREERNRFARPLVRFSPAVHSLFEPEPTISERLPGISLTKSLSAVTISRPAI